MEKVVVELWILWGFASIVFFILEVFLPGFWLATLGVGAIFAAISAFIIKDFNSQLVIFSTFTVIAFIVVRPFALKYFYKGTDKIQTNTDALIGQKVKVLDTIDNINSLGQVKIGGDTWKARSENDGIIMKDEVVEVIKVDGAKVIVKKV